MTALVPGLAPPGRRPHAVDLGAGDGRHAAWLAHRGWRVDAVDYAQEAVARGQARTSGAGVEVAWHVADVGQWEPATALDLVLMSYFTLDQAGFDRVVGWLRPGGHVLVIAHGTPDGSGRGPRDPRFRRTPEALRDMALGLEVLRCESWSEAAQVSQGPHPNGGVVLLARVTPAEAGGPAPRR